MGNKQVSPLLQFSLCQAKELDLHVKTKGKPWKTLIEGVIV